MGQGGGGVNDVAWGLPKEVSSTKYHPATSVIFILLWLKNRYT